jgi:transposase
MNSSQTTAIPKLFIGMVVHNHEVHCCYEAGCCGFWIARQLQPYNWKVLVNPADVPRTN